jgi:phospholipase/carboxylesterase
MTMVAPRTAGAPLAQARAAVIMLHGRGGTAQDILTLADLFAQPDLAYVAPQAAGGSWYPYAFLSPLERNEPALSCALRTVGDNLDALARQGFATERVFLLGFSQGGCLALEYVARHAKRYAGVVGLSAGLIGPDNSPRDYRGSLANSPIFLGCGDLDSHIPLARVREATRVLRAMGGNVTERIYAGMGHAINEAEIKSVSEMLSARLEEAAARRGDANRT